MVPFINKRTYCSRGRVLKNENEYYLEGAIKEFLGFEATLFVHTIDTRPIAEILCVKNGRAIVVCGFLMKSS